ncbi:hypothetical protein G6F23_014471 [Rhizopus arrhizus]|nr:hypothetical protein G6F23_014471 [Rhizopus arrhizus]
MAAICFPGPARCIAGPARGQWGVLRGDAAAGPVAAQPGPARVAGPGRGYCRDAGVFHRTGRPRALAQGSRQLRGTVHGVVAAERRLRTLRTAGHRSGRAGGAPCGDDRVECGHAGAVLRVDLHPAAG